jgi:hypothetical protein
MFDMNAVRETGLVIINGVYEMGTHPEDTLKQ